MYGYKKGISFEKGQKNGGGGEVIFEETTYICVKCMLLLKKHDLNYVTIYRGNWKLKASCYFLLPVDKVGLKI